MDDSYHSYNEQTQEILTILNCSEKTRGLLETVLNFIGADHAWGESGKEKEEREELEAQLAAEDAEAEELDEFYARWSNGEN